MKRPELQDLPDEGVQELLHEAKYHRRNVEDSHSALQEMQARLAVETDVSGIISRVLLTSWTRGSSCKSCLVSRHRRWGLRCPLARTPIGDEASVLVYLNTIKDFAARIAKAMFVH